MKSLFRLCSIILILSLMFNVPVAFGAETNKFSVTATYEQNCVTLSWDQIQNAESYSIYKASEGDAKLIATTGSCIYVDSLILPKSSYNYYAVANCHDAEHAYTVKSLSAYIDTTKTITKADIPQISVKLRRNSAVVSWDIAYDYIGIVIEKSTNNINWYRAAYLKSTMAKSAVISGLQYNSNYYFRVKYFSLCGAVSYSSYSKTATLSLYLGKPQAFSIAAVSYRTAKLRWDKAENSYGSIIYRSSGNGYKQIGKTASTVFYDKSLVPNTQYHYKILPYIMVGTTNYYGSFSAVKPVTVKLSKPVIDAKPSVSYSSATINWEKVSGATGYSVYLRRSGGNWKRCNTTSKLHYKVTGLKTGKKYYIRIRAYRSKNGKKYYSSYSSGCCVNPKLNTPTLKLKKSGNSVKVSGKLLGADVYKIYMYTGGNWKYCKTVKSKKGFSVSIGCESKGTARFKAKAYRTVDGKRIYSKYSKIMSVKL